MGEPKQKPESDKERPVFGPHPADRDLFEGADELRAVDAEAYLTWLATGAGDDPWPESSS